MRGPLKISFILAQVPGFYPGMFGVVVTSTEEQRR